MTRRWPVLLALAAVCMSSSCNDSGEDAAESTIATAVPQTANRSNVDTLVTVPDAAGAPSGAVTASQLEQVLQSYSRCLSQQLVGTIRYNLERFTGMSTDLGLPGGRRSDVVSQHTDACLASTAVDSFIDAFTAANPITADDVTAIANELDHCVGPLSAATDFGSLEGTSMGEVDARFNEVLATLQEPDNVTLVDCYNDVVLGKAIPVEAP